MALRLNGPQQARLISYLVPSDETGTRLGIGTADLALLEGSAARNARQQW